jgi:hypothetical protein
MSPTLTTSPLHETLERLPDLSGELHLRSGTPSGEGWFAPGEEGHVEGLLETVWARLADADRTTDRPYLKQSVFGSYVWQLTACGIGAYLTCGRVPDLSANNVALYVDATGWVDEVALITPRFACLPGDPGAHHPLATVVPDPDALRRSLVDVLLTRHLESIMQAMRTRYRYGMRAMRETLADRIVASLLWLLKERGEDERIHTEVAAFLRLLPYESRSGVLEVPMHDRCESFLDRASCCMSYRLPKYGYCKSCPLQSKEERIERFQAHLAATVHS